MTTEVPTKPTRETWRDWEPIGAPEPNELLTRDELLSRLQAEGVTVSADDLRNWQLAGVIPYGERRWHAGATRVLYPAWMVGTVRNLRRLQGEGYKLGQIGPQLRVLRGLARYHENPTPTPEDDHPWDLDDVRQRLLAVAEGHQRRRGTLPSRVEAALDLASPSQLVVRLYDDRGHPLTFVVPPEG